MTLLTRSMYLIFCDEIMSHFEICICPIQSHSYFQPTLVRRGKQDISRIISPTMFHTSGDINPCQCFNILSCTFRSPSEAEERAGVLGAPVRSAGDPLVLQVQHIRGACAVCGATPLELRYSSQWGWCHGVADSRTGRNRYTTQIKYWRIP